MNTDFDEPELLVALECLARQDRDGAAAYVKHFQHFIPILLLHRDERVRRRTLFLLLSLHDLIHLYPSCSLLAAHELKSVANQCNLDAEIDQASISGCSEQQLKMEAQRHMKSADEALRSAGVQLA